MSELAERPRNAGLNLRRIGRHLLLFVGLGPLFGFLFFLGAMAVTEPESLSNPVAVVSIAVFIALPFTYIVGAIPAAIAGVVSALMSGRKAPVYLSAVAGAGGLSAALFATARGGVERLPAADAFLPIFAMGAVAALACGCVYLYRRRRRG